jgi:hypothetical protein
VLFLRYRNSPGRITVTRRVSFTGSHPHAFFSNTVTSNLSRLITVFTASQHQVSTPRKQNGPLERLQMCMTSVVVKKHFYRNFPSMQHICTFSGHFVRYQPKKTLALSAKVQRSRVYRGRRMWRMTQSQSPHPALISSRA